MKKILLMIFIYTITITSTAYADDNNIIPEIKSPNVILADRSSTIVVYEKNSDVKIQPASLTKIMTAIIALENNKDLNKEVIADNNIISAYDYSFGNMGILNGEKLKMIDLINGALVYDAGEACEIIANNTFDTYGEFIDMMNKKAREIGAKNTHFTNASGAYDKNQYSTVYDLYLISRYAMDNEVFSDIVYQNQYVIEPTNKYLNTRYLNNTNDFVNKYSNTGYYTGLAMGIKASYMKDQGYGLALDIKKGSTELICIVVNSPTENNINYSYKDAKALMDYGFEIMTTIKFISKDDLIEEVPLNNAKGVTHALLKASNNFFITVPEPYDENDIVTTIQKNKDIKAPLKKGDVLGTLTVKYKDTTIGSIDLVSSRDVSISVFKSIGNVSKAIIFSPFFIGIFIILILFMIYKTIKINKKK